MAATFARSEINKMNPRHREFVFRQVYETAAIVESSLHNPESLLELAWDEPDARLGLAKASKVCILHRYIYAMVAVFYRFEYRKHADLYEAEEIAAVEGLLDAYDIRYLRFDKFVSPIPGALEASRADLPFHQWFLSQ